jgi:hypothetical protein
MGALDANYYTEGSTSTDGKTLDNRLESWRVGGTLALPVTRQHSIKLYGSTSIYSRIGSDFDIVGVVGSTAGAVGYNAYVGAP